jgi:hypothetical protein
MFAFGCKGLMPVEMTVESHSLVAIFSHGLTLDFRDVFTTSSASNAINSFIAFCTWLETNFKRLKTRTAAEADEALWMEMFRFAVKSEYPSLDW